MFEWTPATDFSFCSFFFVTFLRLFNHLFTSIFEQEEYRYDNDDSNQQNTAESPSATGPGWAQRVKGWFSSVRQSVLVFMIWISTHHRPLAYPAPQCHFFFICFHFCSFIYCLPCSELLLLYKNPHFSHIFLFLFVLRFNITIKTAFHFVVNTFVGETCETLNELSKVSFNFLLLLLIIRFISFFFLLVLLLEKLHC